MRSVAGALALLSVACAGCSSLMYPGQEAEQQQQAQVDQLQSDVLRLQRQVADVSEAQQRAFAELATLRGEHDSRGRTLDTRLASMERSVSEQSAERERLRQSIVSDVSQKVGALIKAQPAAPAPHRESGYEHVVKPGETLSAIAAAYKVKTTVITQANGLPGDGHTIRVGQKLFIPAP